MPPPLCPVSAPAPAPVAIAPDAGAVADTGALLRWARPAPRATALCLWLPRFLVAKARARAPMGAFWLSLIICLGAVFVAVLRSPPRVLRPRFAPVGGWSRGFAPTRARRPVSHSCQPPRPLVAGAGIPRPVGAERFCGRVAPTFFVGYRFVLRCAFRAVSPLAFLAGFARPARAPIARWQ